MRKAPNKQKPLYFIIHCELYNRYIHVYVGKSDDVVPMVCKNHDACPSDVEMISERYGGACFQLTHGNVGIWISENQNRFTVKNLFSLQTLIHESFHGVSDILRYVGISHSEETEEAYAYLHSWIVGEILKQLEKRK